MVCNEVVSTYLRFVNKLKTCQDMKKFIAIISVLIVLLLLGYIMRPGYTFEEKIRIYTCTVDRDNTDLDESSIERIESLASSVKSWERKKLHNCESKV